MSTGLYKRIQGFDDTFSIFTEDGSSSLDIRNTGFSTDAPLHITNTTASTSTITGALIADGGAGIAGALNVGGVIVSGNDIYTTGDNMVICADQSSDGRMGFVKKAGTGPRIVSASGQAIGLSTSNIANLITGDIGAGTLTDRLLVDTTSTHVLHTTASTSTSTGALIVDGGGGIAGALNVGGVIKTTDTTASTSTTTGAAIIGGGTGIAGALNVGSTTVFGGNVSISQDNIAICADQTSGGGRMGFVKQVGRNPRLGIATGLEFRVSEFSVSNLLTGDISSATLLDLFYVNSTNTLVLQSTASTTTGNGALVVTGGTGIGGALNVGGAIKTTNTTASSSITTGSGIFGGGVGIAGAANIGGVLKVTDATVSSDAASGSIILLGGIGIAGSASIGAQINFVNTAHTMRYFNTNDGLRFDSNTARMELTATTGGLKIFDTTASSSTTTGSGIFGGGVGIAGALNVGTTCSVGTGTPDSNNILVTQSDQNTYTAIRVLNGNTGTSAQALLSTYSDSSHISIGANSSGNTGTYGDRSGFIEFQSTQVKSLTIANISGGVSVTSANTTDIGLSASRHVVLNAATGNQVRSQINSSTISYVNNQGIFNTGDFFQNATVNSITSSTGVTVSTGQTLNSVIKRSSQNAGQTDTFGSAAVIVAAIPGAVVGTKFSLIYANVSGTESITIAAGANGTLYGTSTVATNSFVILTFVLTNVTASSETYDVFSK